MKRFLFRGLLALSGLLVLVGCASLTRPAAGVNVSVTNLLPTHAAMFETSAALTLRLTNESAEPLMLIGSAHRLYLNDTYVGRAVSNEPLSIPPLTTATQTVTVFMENLTLMRKVIELANTNRPIIAYRLESQLHAGASSPGRTLATTSRGELDLTALMATGPLGERRF
jgi:LEA14-like dessication related protein